MKTLFCLTLALAALNPGYALTCYKCNGCETSSAYEETCREIDPQAEASACLTQVIRVGGTAGSMIVKKCAVYGRSEKFDCPTLPSGDTISCQKCHEDLCNSGSTLPTTSSALLAFIAFSVLKNLLPTQ